MLLLCGLLHTIVAIYVLRIVARLLENGYAGPWFWGNVLVVQISVMVMSVSHFAQIFIWAVLLLICGEFAGLDLAIYASTGNYTTVGTGTVAMPEPWRILGPLEALNGVLMLGVSSAVGFAVMHRVLESRLKGRDPTQGLDLP